MNILKSLTFFALFFFSLIICAQKSQSVFKLNKEIDRIHNLDSLLGYEIASVECLFGHSVIIRVKIAALMEQLHEDQKKPIGSENLTFIKSNTNVFMNLRDSLYDFTYRYESAIKLTSTDLKKHNITEMERTKAVMLSTVSALILYDNYLMGAVLMGQDKRVRRVANDPDKGFGVSSNKLREIAKAANSMRNQKRIIRGIEFVEKRENQFCDINDDDYLFLRDLIYSSPSYTYLKRSNDLNKVGKKLHLSQIFLSDLLADFGNNSFNSLSKFFGNATGAIATRKGSMYKNEMLKMDILNELQPLDIILEKTPFKLTDKLIPGYFGHVAIWAGSGNELKGLGLWEHEFVEAHHSDIAPGGDLDSKDGGVIIEALRSGVKLSTLNHFMNVDDFVILRPYFPDSLSLGEKKESLLLAFRQLGKEYDFNFDINTTEKIVCSELAYVCFPQFDWDTEKIIGRHTISPDNVAAMSWQGDRLKLIAFYRDGVKCLDSEKERILKDVILGREIDHE
jgi:hypothetical protein